MLSKQATLKIKEEGDIDKSSTKKDRQLQIMNQRSKTKMLAAKAIEGTLSRQNTKFEKLFKN